MTLLTLGSLLAPATPDPTAPAAIAEAVPVDDFGRPLVQTDRPPFGRVFQPRVRDRLAGVQPPWSPEQLVSALRRAEQGDLSAQSELFEHMEDRDGALAGFMATRRLAPCGLKWSIEPADDSPKALAIAEMVKAEVSGIPNFAHAFRDMQDAIGKGVTALWIDWQNGGRTPQTRYRIDGLHYVNPKRYRFDWKVERFLILPDDVISGVGSGVGVEPEPWKVIIHRTRTRSGHPAKAGVLRVVALDFLLRNYALKDFAVYCDVYGMPLRLGKYEPGASDEDKAVLADALQHLGTDAAAIVSKMTDIQFEEAHGGAASSPYAELHKLCERQMQLGILGQDQTNTHNATGGRTQVQYGGSKVRQDLLEADCLDVQATLSAQLLYPIVGFSSFGWDAANMLCPKFRLSYEPEDDYTKMIEVDVQLHTVLKLPTTVGQLAKRYGRELPEGVNPDEILKFDTPPPPLPGEIPAGPRRVPAAAASLLLSSASGDDAQGSIDDLGDRGVTAAEAALAALAAPIRAIVTESASLEEAESRLRKAFGDLDSKALEKVVRRGVFVARLQGRATGAKGTE